MIEFNRAPFVGSEMKYIQKAIENGKLCGDGPFTKECSRWIKERYHSKEVLLTTSCTHALEMAAFLADIRPGDEVIMPSYTFVSTADAFVLRGAKIVFVDIRPDTMNIDETKIEEAITDRTKAVVPVHYAGVGCAMDEIMELAGKYHLKVIEDAAQGVHAAYKGRALGTIGDFGCYSFHETKTIPWEKEERCFSRTALTWNRRRSCGKRDIAKDWKPDVRTEPEKHMKNIGRS